MQRLGDGVDGLADDVVVMKKGQVVEAGPTDAIFNNPQQDYTRNADFPPLAGKIVP